MFPQRTRLTQIEASAGRVPSLAPASGALAGAKLLLYEQASKQASLFLSRGVGFIRVLQASFPKGHVLLLDEEQQQQQQASLFFSRGVGFVRVLQTSAENRSGASASFPKGGLPCAN